jgi:hypothetical protein
VHTLFLKKICALDLEEDRRRNGSTYDEEEREK